MCIDRVLIVCNNYLFYSFQFCGWVEYPSLVAIELYAYERMCTVSMYPLNSIQSGLEMRFGLQRLDELSLAGLLNISVGIGMSLDSQLYFRGIVIHVVSCQPGSWAAC